MGYSGYRRILFTCVQIYQREGGQRGGGGWIWSTLDSYACNDLRGYKWSSVGWVWSQQWSTASTWEETKC